MSKDTVKQRYLHRKALACVLSNHRITIAIAGRGWSKSTLAGARILRTAKEMPRSLGMLAGLTYTQLLSKVLPSMQKEWMAAGLKPDRPKDPGHYVIGRMPPPYFKRPVNEPLTWSNAITFFWGSAIELISADRPDLMAGGSYDYQIIDEAVYFPKEPHDTKLIPSLRGNVQYFGKCPLHGSRLYVSSQAWDPSGYWVEDQKFKRAKGGGFELTEEGQPVKRKDALFIHGTSWDNLAILTRDTLEEWERTLPSHTYDIEIMAKRSEVVADAFYSEFKKQKHTYMPASHYDYSEKNEYGVYVKQDDADRDPRLPLYWSLDLGVTFNSLVVSQWRREDRELRFIRNFYESRNQLLSGLVDQAADYYRNHPEREIHLYGDPAGNRQLIMENIGLFEQIEDRLRQKGWKVVNHMEGRAYPDHRIRHQYINQMLAETIDGWPRLRYNQWACKELLTSITNAGMTSKLKKNKSSERANVPQETATHLSDAHDYQIWYLLYDLTSEDGFSEERGGDARFGGKLLR